MYSAKHMFYFTTEPSYIKRCEEDENGDHERGNAKEIKLDSIPSSSQLSALQRRRRSGLSEDAEREREVEKNPCLLYQYTTR